MSDPNYPNLQSHKSGLTSGGLTIKSKSLINLIVLVCISLTSTISIAANDERITVSGYGSIYAGKTFSDDEVFMADFASVGQYRNELSFEPDTMLALQGRGVITDKLSITAQIAMQASEDFVPEFTSFYATYLATDNLTLMAGKRPIPMYYFSEYYDVGFAYPWVRPPANLYWWYITEMDGLYGSYTFDVADIDQSITLFYGNGKSIDDKMINFYFPIFEQSDEEWTDIAGINWSLNGSFYDLRVVYFTHDAVRTQFNTGQPDTLGIFTQKFVGVGGSVNFDQFTLHFDYNDVTRESTMELGTNVNRTTKWPTYLISLAYTFDDYQPFISYSKADNSQQDILNDVLGSDDDYEQHELFSLGLRYNISTNAALKAQIDIFDDQGFEPRGWDVHGDSSTFTFGIDFIF